jgi:Na+-transporting methylmalonyl-CoA/oxaloacetate decarboxylase gamma subunit
MTFLFHTFGTIAIGLAFFFLLALFRAWAAMGAETHDDREKEFEAPRTKETQRPNPRSGNSCRHGVELSTVCHACDDEKCQVCGAPSLFNHELCAECRREARTVREAQS